MSEFSKIKINLLGKDYTIRGEGGEKHLLEIANYVSDKMKTIQKINKELSNTKIAVLTALNIADEYIRLKKEYDSITEKAVNKAKTLISLLDEGLLGNF